MPRKTKAIHYRCRYWNAIVCGAIGESIEDTAHSDLVTCKACRQTIAFREAFPGLHQKRVVVGGRPPADGVGMTIKLKRLNPAVAIWLRNRPGTIAATVIEALELLKEKDDEHQISLQD